MKNKTEIQEPEGQYNLGVMHAKGQGVPKDGEEAVKWYRLAADQGHAQAQYNLGGMYFKGEGVAENGKEAVKWFRLAAEQGHVGSQHFLAVMYEFGKGVLQDNVMAHMWLNIVSANGDKDASERRDKIAGLMTSADISKAQSMARECMSSNYKNCGW